jgi:glycosyltransferase involved in cell wall biosynthesis
LVEKAYSGLKNAHLVGRLSHPEGVRKFYMSNDVYALPSGLDCCPTTILEASLCAKPIVASKVGGIPELIAEGQTGWTVQNGLTDKWISAIRSVLEDAVMAQRIGENARRYVLDHFGWSTQAGHSESIFEELVS